MTSKGYNMNNTIKTAYDNAMNNAEIDADSISRNGFAVSVKINGKLYSARAKTLTERGIRDALADCLADHCAIAATLAAAGAR